MRFWLATVGSRNSAATGASCKRADWSVPIDKNNGRAYVSSIASWLGRGLWTGDGGLS